MKKNQSMKIAVLALILVMIFSGCRKGAKIQPDVKNVMVSISAPRTRVFEETSIALVSRGFVIITANDSLGLLTTEYKNVEEGFRQSFIQGVFSSKQHPRVQFVTNITERDGRSTLTITAKGQILYKKRYWVDYIFSDDFMNVVRQLGEEIKAASEKK